MRLRRDVDWNRTNNLNGLRGSRFLLGGDEDDVGHCCDARWMGRHVLEPVRWDLIPSCSMYGIWYDMIDRLSDLKRWFVIQHMSDGVAQCCAMLACSHVAKRW